MEAALSMSVKDKRTNDNGSRGGAQNYGGAPALCSPITMSRPPHSAIQGEFMALSDSLVDQLLKEYKRPEDLLGENGILKDLTKRLLERALAGELTHPPWLRETRP